jgi:predicted dehydrogenase
MIHVGIVGLGFMGMIHYLAYQQLPGVRVAAICTRSEQRRRGDWTGIRGNFGPAGCQMDLAGVATYARLEDMLAGSDVDLIDVTLPSALHVAATIAAIQAGKHVLCEKPLALERAACDRMAEAARAGNRRLFVGHVLPFFPEYAWALAAVRSDAYGPLQGAAFRRVTSNPTWVANYWSASECGGPLFDLHVHDAHFIRLIAGMPERATSRGRLRDGIPEFWHTLFEFAGGPAIVEATCGTIDQQGRAFDHGFEIRLEEATLLFQFAMMGGVGRYLCPPTMLDSQGRAVPVELSAGDPLQAFVAELSHVLQCLQDDQDSNLLNSQFASDAIQLCELQRASLLSSHG